jgi:8-oxo-dGTP diphosphatase
MQRYVAGFAFSERVRHSQAVLLVRKLVPKWQAGLLNAVGGKIEEGETPSEAMEREFCEEAEVRVPGASWHCFCVERHADYEVHFFRTTLSRWEQDRTKNKNDVGETLHWVETHQILRGDGGIIGNLYWLIPMALDWRKLHGSVIASDNIVCKPQWESCS